VYRVAGTLLGGVTRGASDHSSATAAAKAIHPQLILLASALTKEPAGERLVPNHGDRSQTTIRQQPLAITVDQLLQRRQLHITLGADHPNLA
jgi:hypothetical protein